MFTLLLQKHYLVMIDPSTSCGIIYKMVQKEKLLRDRDVKIGSVKSDFQLKLPIFHAALEFGEKKLQPTLS